MEWMPLTGETLARLESQFIMPSGTSLREAVTAKPSFYTNGDIVRASNGEGSASLVAAGRGDLGSRSFYPLNGSVEDIFDANDAAGLYITEENAIEYLRFFHDYLSDPSGERFVIMESLDGFCLIDEEHRHRPKPTDMRLVYKGSPSEGDFAFRAYVTFRGELSEATMVVHADGSVEMAEEEPQGHIIPAHREPEVVAGLYQ